MKQIELFSVLMALFLVTVTGSFAADYPTKPITPINSMPPGGTLDLQARAFASVAEKMLGQPIVVVNVVVNKVGATGMVGALAGAQAAPDGYTLTVADCCDQDGFCE